MTDTTRRRRRKGDPFPLFVQGGDTYQSRDEAMDTALPILGKIIADLARRDWQRQIDSEDHGQEENPDERDQESRQGRDRV